MTRFRTKANQVIHDLIRKKKHHVKITALTAYDYAFAKLIDESGIDIVLVGDSVGMVALGYETTLPVSMDDMMHHLKAVRRGVKHALVVVDMPFGSYKTTGLALKNAKRMIEEGGADAVKLEGGAPIVKQIEALIKKRIPVMGHLGMTPQSIKELGGYKVQGRTKESAETIRQDARTLEKLGVFSIVLECVPNSLAETVSDDLRIPTIGIGAGLETDGQVLVLYDLLGLESSVKPRFVRRYADFNRDIRRAVTKYREDVLHRKFPKSKESFGG